MGRVGEAIDMLLHSSSEKSTSATAQTFESNFAPGKALICPSEIENLTTLELLYHLNQIEGVPLVGDPARAFATFDTSRGILNIYSKAPDYMKIVSHHTVSLLAALDCAKNQGASFNVCGDNVICVLRDVTVQGASYGEAALRALLKYQLTHC